MATKTNLQQQRRDELKQDIKGQAKRYIKGFMMAAQDPRLGLDIDGLVNLLKPVRDGRFTEVNSGQKERSAQTVQMLNELIDRKVEHHNRTNSQNMSRPDTPVEQQIKNLFSDLQDYRALDEDDELITGEEMAERARKRLDAPVRITYCCDPRLGPYSLDNLDEVAHPGKLKVIQSNRYGEGVYESDVLESPTYAELAREANQVAKLFNYRDHRTFGGFTIRRRDKLNRNVEVGHDVIIARLVLDS